MIDLYKTTTLLQLIQGVSLPSTFLRDRYAPTNDAQDIFGTESVLAEYRDAEQRMAPIVTERSGGVAVSRIGERMREFEPPLISIHRPITVDDIQKRNFGEALYPTITPAEREANLALRDMAELDGMITRREEWMVSEVLLTNGCTAKAINDDPDEQQTFEVHYYEGEESKATFAPGTDWDEDTATIFEDLEEATDMLESRGLPAEDLVCAPDVAHAILRNPEVVAALDNRRYEWGESRPRKLAPGASIVAVLNVGGFDINVISYGAKYVEGEGKEATVKPYMPKGMAFLTAPNCLRTLYGAITQLEQGIDGFQTRPFRRVPKFVSDDRANIRDLYLSARPLPIPNNLNPSISIKAISE